MLNFAASECGRNKSYLYAQLSVQSTLMLFSIEVQYISVNELSVNDIESFRHTHIHTKTHIVTYYTKTHAHRHMHTDTYTQIHIYTHIHTYTHVQTHIYTHVQIYTYAREGKG